MAATRRAERPVSCRPERQIAGSRIDPAPTAADSLPLSEWMPGTPAAALSTMVFGGRCVAIRGIASVARVVSRATAIVEEVFGSAEPERAERHMSESAFVAAARRARRQIADDDVLGGEWRATLEQLGYTRASCYSDRLRLRVVPSSRMHSVPTIRALPPHRDNWASNIGQQINWWLPIYPLAPTRTMIVWPGLFRNAVANNSATWDYETLRAAPGGDYPLLPTVTEAPPDAGLPLLSDIGTLVAFSGAHLHASSRDDSGVSRLSLDTRTVWAEDVRAGRGAPDVDGGGRKPHWEWFRNDADPDGSALAALGRQAREDRL